MLNFEAEEFSFVSANNLNNVYCKIIKPKNIKPKGIVQISHGMCEYFDRYEEFTKYLLENGFIVCGNDDIGHGNSINSENDRGYFSKKDGYKYLIEDTKTLNNIVRDKFNNLPIFLFGHSMGSLVLRCYIAKYGDSIDGAILCGTVGPQPLATAGIKLANIMAKSKGDHYKSQKLYNLALDFANIKFFPVSTRFDWTCSDEEEVKKHVTDEKRNFLFTVSAFSDVFRLVNLSNSNRVIKTIPKNLPLFLISGELDPIGENGIGVKKVFKLYKEQGIKNVTIKLYPKARHELVNEKIKEEVYEDILNWIYKNSNNT